MPQPRITVRLPPEIGDATAEEAVRAIRAYRKHRKRVERYRERQKRVDAVIVPDALVGHAAASPSILVNEPETDATSIIAESIPTPPEAPRND